MRAFKAILVVLIVGALAAGSASARGRGGQGHGPAHGGGRGEGRAGPPAGGRGASSAPPYANPPFARAPIAAPRYARGGGYPPDGAYVPRGYARPELGGYPAYAPPPAAFTPRGGWRRGQFLPGGPAGGQPLDPRRFRLRSPPPGYGWYGVGRDAYLVQRSTGLILDTAPGAW